MIRVVLDSGAFTAWSRGAEIDLDEYIAYIKHNAEGVDHYVALDVIPGKFGKTPTAKEVEESAAKSWDNLQRMKAEGLRPVPVFHQGEQFKWLHKMVDEGWDYVGISPANDRTTGQKRVWLDRVFHEITDSAGMPIIKTHAFGMTSIPLLIRYPWFSADSASWIMFGARGSVLIPYTDFTGEFTYDRPPQPVPVTVQRASARNSFQTLPPVRQKQVLKFLELAGCTLEQVQESDVWRLRACAVFFLEFGKWHTPVPFKRRKHSLFKDK